MQYITYSSYSTVSNEKGKENRNLYWFSRALPTLLLPHKFGGQGSAIRMLAGGILSEVCGGEPLPGLSPFFVDGCLLSSVSSHGLPSAHVQISPFVRK